MPRNENGSVGNEQHDVDAPALAERMKGSRAIQTFAAENTEDLLALLSPLKSDVWQGNAFHWVFRGHGRIAWKLLPTACRDDPLLPEAGQSFWSRDRRDTVLSLLRAEREALMLFLKQVDDAGLAFAQPEPYLFIEYPDGDIHRRKWLEVERGCSACWPWPELYPHLALAQHSGIATRLLDWTDSPFVAAHFAASEGAREFRKDPSGKGRCAVWGYRKEISERGHLYAELLRVQRNTNPNMRAQEGLFTLTRERASTDQPAQRLGLEEVILGAEARGELRELSQFLPVLVRIDFPQSLCGELLEKLYMLRQTSNRFFPSYEGAAASLKEREFWPDTRKSIEEAESTSRFM